ncbi:MAG TPA: DUF2784 domain-containing protein [Bryobacterales bacterium]|nr:DUF2784 domain-containing protein [Bryobacterales bacterium]
MRGYVVLAGAALSVHLLWIGWVIFGALVTRGRRALAWLHIASLVYGIAIEIALWPCPLTLLEDWLRGRAGLGPYQGGFLIHHLDALVYPDVSQGLLTGVAVAVCGFNLGVYGLRMRRGGVGRR